MTCEPRYLWDTKGFRFVLVFERYYQPTSQTVRPNEALSAPAPMADPLLYPHPLVTSSTLYAREVPVRVKWDHLVATCKPCGAVSQGEVTRTKGVAGKKSPSRTWALVFADTAHAELALATLAGTPIKGLPPGSPPCTLALFHSAHPSAADEPSASWALPQYVIGLKLQQLSPSTIFALFAIFRRVGPLVSLKLDGDLGRDAPVCVVRYWNREHAVAAVPAVPIGLRKRFSVADGALLKTYDPGTILVTNLNNNATAQDLRPHFEKFGFVVEICMEKYANGDTASCTITFATEDAARQARVAMNYQMIGGRSISVTFVEYGSRQTGSTPKSGNQSWREEPFSRGSGPGHSGNSSHARRQAREAAMDKLKAAEAAQATATSKVVAAVKDQERASTRLEEASDLHDQRRDELWSVEYELEDAQAKLDDAQEKLDEAYNRYNAAENRHDRVLQNYGAAEARVDEAQQALDKADQDAKAATVHVEHARMAAVEARRTAQAARDVVAGLANDEPCGQEEEVRDEVRESIRRMQELREQEERDRRARQAQGGGSSAGGFDASEKRQEEARQAAGEARAKEAKAKEEADQRNKAEAERKAAEQKQKEEAARREAEAAAKKAYAEAARKETERCSRRDDAICMGTQTWWPADHALQRFELVSSEFDAIQFSELQPLTVLSIPWPMLQHPRTLDVAQVAWDMVDEFFEEVGYMLSPGEYRTLVEKTHRRFHPDKWRARRLLLSVRDEELRKSLETAGNVVAQAMTPLWRKSKDNTDSDDERW